MTDFDYKKYSLENLENWMQDALSCSEATPQEIYDVIKRVVEENYYIYKDHTSRCYELLALLNGNGVGHIKEYDDCVDKILSCDKDDPSPECQKSWNDFWGDVDEKNSREYNLREAEYYNKRAELDADTQKTWTIPVEFDGEDAIVTLPEELIKMKGWSDGDVLEWVDREDGSWELRKA